MFDSGFFNHSWGDMVLVFSIAVCAGLLVEIKNKLEAIRFMMAKDQTIGWSLFGFNIGLEAGQVCVVLGILLVSYLVIDLAGFRRKWWVWALSTVALCIATKMAQERWPL